MNGITGSYSLTCHSFKYIGKFLESIARFSVVFNRIIPNSQFLISPVPISPHIHYSITPILQHSIFLLQLPQKNLQLVEISLARHIKSVVVSGTWNNHELLGIRSRLIEFSTEPDGYDCILVSVKKEDWCSDALAEYLILLLRPWLGQGPLEAPLGGDVLGPW